MLKDGVSAGKKINFLGTYLVRTKPEQTNVFVTNVFPFRSIHPVYNNVLGKSISRRIQIFTELSSSSS